MFVEGDACTQILPKRWSDEAYGKVCHTVVELVKAVELEVPRIQKLMRTIR